MTIATERDADRLARMLRPRGVAVVGASDQPGSLGTRFIHGLVHNQFPGDVYPVNPRYTKVAGLTSYSSVLDIPGLCDVAVVSVPAAAVEQVLRDCAEKGVAGMVLFSSGYAESGPEGAAAERQLASLARHLGVRLMGPNSPGFMNFVDRAIVTAVSVAFRPSLSEAGRLGVVAQSAGVAGIIAERGLDRGIGLSFMICTGNEADVDTAEAIEFLAADDYTASLAVYLEGIGDGERMMRAWQRASDAGKPIVVYKPGRSPASVQAAKAHTGSLVSDDGVFDGLARQYGVVRAYDLDELLDVAAAIPMLPSRPFESVLLLTTSGGISVLTSDELGRAGLTLPELDVAIQRELAKGFNQYAILSNPVDMTSDFVSDPRLFKRSMELVSGSAAHDVVVLVLGIQRPEFASLLADMVLEVPAALDGRIVVMWYGGEMSRAARDRLRAQGVTLCETPRAVARALAGARLWHRRAQLVGPVAPRPVACVEPGDVGDLFALLASCGVPVAPSAVLAPGDDVASALELVPGPWAVKAASLDLGRKSDVGGVHLALATLDEVLAACEAVRRDTGVDRVLIQSMVSAGLELLVSIWVDETFGPVAVLGLGGRLTELVGRSAVRRPPLSRDDVVAALEDSALSAVLGGFRGAGAVDPQHLAVLVNRLADAAERCVPVGGVLELNPVIVGRDGELVCVDVKRDTGGES